MNLASQSETYLAHVRVERGLSDNTLAAYARDLGRYRRYLAAQGVDDLSRVAPEHVAGFAQAVSSGTDGGTALAPASASRAVVAVRGWHRFALDEGWTATDSSAGVKPRAVPSRLPKAISTHDVFAILEAVDAGAGGADETPALLRDRALLEALYATGGRISEIVGLDVDDISLEPGEESALLRGKGSKERVVPIGGAARDAIASYLVRGRPALAAKGRGTSAVFLNLRGSRLSRQSAWSILKAAAERAHVPDVSPHTFRHSFATHLLSGGADVRVVQELLGHADVSTTQVYTLVTRDSLREAYTAAHPRALG